MSTSKELWAKVDPDIIPEMARESQAVPAYKDGRITGAELRQLVAWTERRDRRHLKQLGYSDDDD